jgi:PAS domain S-box-containing protein
MRRIVNSDFNFMLTKKHPHFKFSHIYSIRLIVPILLIFFSAAVGLYILHERTHTENARVEDRVSAMLGDLTNRMKSILEYLIKQGHREMAQEQVASLGSLPNLKIAILFDENNVVIAATQRDLIGKTIQEIPFFHASERLDDWKTPLSNAKRNSGTSAVFKREQKELAVFCPIILGSKSGEVRPSLIGAFYIAYDLETLKAETRYLVFQQVKTYSWFLAFLSVFFGILFHFIITRRVYRLAHAIERFSSGDFTVRVKTVGNDEFTVIEKGLNGMIANIVEDRKALEERTCRLQELNQSLEKEVADRKQAEDSLQKLNQYNKSILQSLYDAISVIDVKTHKILDVNQVFIEQSGFGREEILGKKCYEIAHRCMEKCAANDSECPIVKTVATGQKAIYEHSHYTKNGKTFYVEVVASPLINENGHFTQVLHISRDITERNRLKSRIRQVEKMEAIGTLAGGIAHDFNNILMPIIGYTELTMGYLPDYSRYKTYLTEVIKASNRAKQLVEQILTFSRKTEEKLKPVFILPIIKEALALVRASLPTTIEIRQNVSNDFKDMLIMADPIQIHQVLMNLCTNAYHAMRQFGGTLDVTMKKATIGENDESMTTELAAGDYAAIIVQDSGHGIDEHILARIFEPYFTTKTKGEGSGMGLAVVHGIIKSCGGSISVRSEVEKGSEFHIFLPVAQCDDFVSDDAAALEIAPTGQEHILVVDDEPQIADVLKQMLEILGYHVSAYTDSKKALEFFKKNPTAFDIVLTDQTMPQMTGVVLAAEMLAIRQDIPIILCTGFSETISEKEAKQLGICDFFMKPIRKNELANLIRKTLDEKTVVLTN